MVITANPNNYLLTALRATLLNYWKQETIAIDYFIFHLMLTSLIINDKKCKSIYEKMLSLSSRNPHLLQLSLGERCFDNLFEETISSSFIHKLTYKKLDKYKNNSNNFYNILIQRF